LSITHESWGASDSMYPFTNLDFHEKLVRHPTRHLSQYLTNGGDAS